MAIGTKTSMNRAVQFLQKPGVDEVFWIRGFCSGDFFRKFGEYGFESFKRRIRLYRDKTFEQLIAFFELFGVGAAHVLT